MRDTLPSSNGRRLPPNHDSLAFGVPAAKAGTIYALAITGGITVSPKEGRTLLFGRNRPEVHVCIGEDDRRVSRQQGELTHHADRWWVRSTGRVPLRLPGSRLLFPGDEPLPLAAGYTPLFVRGSGRREHLMELFVAGPEAHRAVPRHDETTEPPKTWKLSAAERLALIVLAQRYLYHEAYPQPLTWSQAAEHLADLQPGGGWRPKKVEHLVAGVRARLSQAGVTGLTREEVGEPVGNTLNHNLVRELVESTTLVPPDLRLLDRPAEDG